MNRIKALFFDVFGTLVDWRTSVAREVDAMAARQGTRVDALAFAESLVGDSLAPPAHFQFRNSRRASLE